MLKFWILSKILFLNQILFIQEWMSPTFGAKKWNPILHWFLTFDAKSLKLIVKRSWDSTFDTKS